ncbi:hypothetical protein KEM52_003907 [Ascosphaera acerosa]|nr:hypothetical protein KEM52_003907 [Ascosphaera acerosa]
MRIFRSSLIVVAFGLLQVAVANSWVGQTGTANRDRWQEVELKRWLADHDIPYPSATSREDLEQLVRDNWQHKIAAPMSRAKDSVVDSMVDAKQWVFDTWDDTALKKFLDRHGVTAPAKKDHNALLQAAIDSYDAIATKAGETARYPGDWLYETWSDSQLKEYLDKRGYRVPQHSTRDRMIAAVRRVGFLASKKYDEKYSQAASAAKSAKDGISDAALQKWSDADLRRFFEQHGIKVPHGYSRDQIMGMVEKYRHLFTASASAAMASATSYVADMTGTAAHATGAAEAEADRKFQQASQLWSDMRLKEYLAARDVKVRARASRDELLKLVYENRDKAAHVYGSWVFDTMNMDNLKQYIASSGHQAEKQMGQTREQLLSQARAAYDKASRTSGADWSAATDYIASKARSAADLTLHGWSRRDIENYLKSFGIAVAPSLGLDDLRREAQSHARYFKYGLQTGRAESQLMATVRGMVSGVWGMLRRVAFAGRQHTEEDVGI